MAICFADDLSDPRNAPIAPDICACCGEPLRPGEGESCERPGCQYDHEELCRFCRCVPCQDCGGVYCTQHMDCCECAAAKKTAEEEMNAA